MKGRTDEERQPLLRSRSSIHGTAAPAGKSSLFQTVFNSTNVLLGVGLLSLPLGFKHAGWVVGIIVLTFSAVVTAYTARLLARCLDSDKSLATYTDIAFASYGSTACTITRILFSFITIAACVALVILFGDTMSLLAPSITVLQWKIVCGVILIPLHFVPFSLLSISSMVGIAASFGLVLMTILAGILKHDAPGSLHQPAATSLFPDSWSTIPLSFGLIMSPWGGHAAFPNLYRDMRDPAKYNRVLLFTFSSTYAIDLSMAVCGLLMYGRDTLDEIVANILVTTGQPHAILVVIIALVALMPVTKIPLNSRPLIMMIECSAGLDPTVKPTKFVDHQQQSPPSDNFFLRSALRVLVITVIVCISIICPKFDIIMAFVGSALCYTICIILPLVFYLKLFERSITRTERVVDWVLIVLATVMASMGTVWAVVPGAVAAGGTTAP